MKALRGFTSERRDLDTKILAEAQEDAEQDLEKNPDKSVLFVERDH